MIQEFLDKSRRTLKKIKQLEKILSNMEECIRKKLTTILNKDEEGKLDVKMDDLDMKFDVVSGEVKQAIISRREETEKMKEEGELDKHEVMLREVHVYRHFKCLTEIASKYRNIKSEFRKREKEILRQRCEVLNPEVTEDELERMLAGGTGGIETNKGIKDEMERGKRILVMAEKLTKIEIMINELNELVNKNTKIIDDIVVNVTRSEKSLKETNENLKKTIKYQKRVNLLKRIIVTLAVLCIIGLLVFIGVPRRRHI